METTLRMFYARAIPLILVFGSLLVIALTSATVALAQDAAPAAPEGSTKDLIDLVFSSAAAGAMSLGAVVLAFVAKHIPAWLTPVLDFITTSEAKRWEDLTTAALDRAEAYARARYDVLKDRAGYVNAMAIFLAQFNREITQWADKNGNGIIDLIETRLPPAPDGRKPAAAPAAAFMDAQDKRGAGALRQKGPQH